MNVEILSPEKTIYSDKAELITLPGVKGMFTILKRHAPLISALCKGTITYRVGGQEYDVEIDGGFVEVKNNSVTVCID